MLIDWAVKNEGKGTRTIQYPDERIGGIRDGPEPRVDVLLWLHGSRLWTSADDGSPRYPSLIPGNNALI